MIEFKVRDFYSAAEWCEKNIGPRLFWIHSSIGGSGWSLNQKYNFNNEITLIIEDDKKALLAMLSLGDKNERNY